MSGSSHFQGNKIWFITNLELYLFNPSQICKIEAMEAVLFLIKYVTLF